MFVNQYRMRCDECNCHVVFNCVAENQEEANVKALKAGWLVKNIGRKENVFMHKCPNHRRQ